LGWQLPNLVWSDLFARLVSLIQKMAACAAWRLSQYRER
jgi:hypothetical protein